MVFCVYLRDHQINKKLQSVYRVYIPIKKNMFQGV